MSDLLEHVHVELRLVAQHNGELLKEHVQDVIVTHKKFLLRDLVAEDLFGRHTGRGLLLDTMHGALYILNDFFGNNERADVRMLCKEDYYFVTGDSDSHIGTTGIRHSQ